MDVYKGKLVTIKTDDGFDFTYFLRQTGLATATALIINLEQNVAHGAANDGHIAMGYANPPVCNMDCKRKQWSGSRGKRESFWMVVCG